MRTRHTQLSLAERCATEDMLNAKMPVPEIADRFAYSKDGRISLMSKACRTGLNGLLNESSHMKTGRFLGSKPIFLGR